MDNDLLTWIVNELDEKYLKDICNREEIRVPGFRNGKRYPKILMITNILKNKNKIYTYLKNASNFSEEKKELNDKNITQIESIIDITNKHKTIHQIIYLITQDNIEYTNFAYKIVNQIREKDGAINNEDKKINKIGKLNQVTNTTKKENVIKKNKSELKKFEFNESEKKYDNNQDNVNNGKKDDNMIKNEKIINKFIVTVEEKNRFYNIYPLYKIDGKSLIKIEREEYPEYGNINVNPYSEFSKRNYDNLYICRFNQSELEETRNKTKFKIDGDILVKNNNIYNINEEGIYEIAELIEDSSDLEELIYNDKIEIKNKPIKEKVYIKDDSYVYGPFGYIANNRGGGYYIDKEKNDYIIEKYPIKDNEENFSIIEIENPYVYSSSYIKAVYFYNEQNLISEKIDTISNQKLMYKLKQVIDVKNTHYSKEEIDEIRENIYAIVNNYLSEERRKRIENLIINTEMTEKFIQNDLIDIINLLLDGKNTKKNIANKILEQNEILRKLQNVELVQAKIESKNEELEKAKQELEIIQYEIEDVNNKNEQKLIEKMQLEIKDIKDKKEKLQKNIEELTQKYQLCTEIDILEKTIKDRKKKAKEAEDDYNVFSRKNQNKKNEAEKIEKEIKDKLANATSISQYSDIAFDGMIANEMLESASKWSKKRNIEDYENSIASKEKVGKVLNVKSFKDKEIIEYIYNKFTKFRNYSKNDIINMMMCINQGFITVFAGEPGVGKTSACNIIANVLGLSNRDDNYNRFTEVSVEKGWTSKKDLIGYYNPLTKSFDKNNGALFKTFNILDQEYKRKIYDFPYYILLDEANLSSMEHYWADFMNVCDFDKEYRKINLGEDYIYHIPKTLRFLATINYDHTTETLSPRLIDRAWVILLETNNSNLNFNSDEEYEQIDEDIIMFKNLETIFSSNSSEEEVSNQIFSELDEIYKKFNENNLAVSPRVKNMIINYLKVGCSLFDETDNTPSSEFVALDYAVAQKLLPKINGYGEEYKIFLQDIQNRFDKNNMVRCRNIVSKIIKKGNTNMQYYQFFS